MYYPLTAFAVAFCMGTGITEEVDVPERSITMEKGIVRVICAIGQSGQLGLDGRMPWEGNRSPEYNADVARFFEITRGHVLLGGPRTIASVPEFAREDRELFIV